MNITSEPTGPRWPIGTNVTLTCTVEFSSAIDIQGLVTVNTEWTGPAGFMSTATTIMENNTTYYNTSTKNISLKWRYQSGIYTCTTTFSSNSPFLFSSSKSATMRITLGIYFQSYSCRLLVVFVYRCISFTKWNKISQRQYDSFT